MIYGFLPLLIVFIASAPSASSLRLPVIAAHSIPRLLSSMMVLQFIASFLSMPETIGVGRNESPSAFACPGENPRAAICDAANHVCRAGRLKTKKIFNR